MKELSFNYRLDIQFSSPVTNHRFTVRCVPQDSERQKIIERKIEILPDESLSHSVDSFGNDCIYGQCVAAHELFRVNVCGVAQTGLEDSEYAGEAWQMGRYRYPTPVTRPGQALRQFFSQFSFREDRSNLEKSTLLMQGLAEHFVYRQGVTNIQTTAEEAFVIGQGVCQDYAHILISLCQMAGIPARYVVGMLIGEGASHAWVEIFDRKRWFALDPTNMVTVTDGHIKISAGRDYSDCVINQGVFVGNAKQKQEVEVIVEECGKDGIG